MANIVVLFCFYVLIISLNLYTVGGIYCYQCVNTEPGCGDPFHPLLQRSARCSLHDDVCVKVIEQKQADTLVTRDCRSNLVAHRRDLAADLYEGCRRAARDPKLAVFVSNSVQEVDVKRDYYDSVQFCVCHHRDECNSGVLARLWLPGAAVLLALTLALR